MNMRLMTAQLCAVLFLSASPAIADGHEDGDWQIVLGVQAGYNLTDSTTESSGVRFFSGLNGPAAGLFGQFTHPISDDLFVGVHIGMTKESAEDYAGQQGGPFKVKLEWSADVLARIGYDAGKIRPFIGAGASLLRVETPYVMNGVSGSDDALLKGWKAVLGIDVPITDNVVGHMVLHHARYSDEKVIWNDLAISGDQTGARFGLGYVF